MLQSNLIRGEWPILAHGMPVSRRASRLIEALRLLKLRLDAAHHYAEARGPALAAAGSGRRGARLVSGSALKWHQQMRRLDTLMLAPQRSLAARIVWRLTRAWASRQGGAGRCAAA